MNTSAIIFGIIVILIIVLPIVMLNTYRKKREKRLFQQLAQFAGNQHATVTLYEVWGTSAIGMDEAQNKLFFTKNIQGMEIFMVATLPEIEKCTINTITRMVRDNESNISVTDKLELVLRFIDKSKEDLILPIYNAKTDSLTLSGELQLIEKWNTIINKSLKSK